MNWEQRWHPLRREWIIVAAHRQSRPWDGTLHGKTEQVVPAHAPACHLCPGNTRVGGASNPPYKGVYVFENDHPCVSPDAPRDVASPGGIYRAVPNVHYKAAGTTATPR